MQSDKTTLKSEIDVLKGKKERCLLTYKSRAEYHKHKLVKIKD